MSGRTRGAIALLGAAIVAGLTVPAHGTPGVTKRAVSIGVHVPATGAAPLGNNVEEGARLYWRWLRARGAGIHGRTVRVAVRNDNGNPSQAVARCRELVEDEGVFMLSGLMNDGTVGNFTVQACARYAASVGVPYVSLGGITQALDRLPRYFAASMRYIEQARLLADYFVSKLRARRVPTAVLYHDAPNGEEAAGAFRRAMERRGADVDLVRKVPGNAASSDAQLVVQEMSTAGIGNVFVFARSNFVIQVLIEAERRAFYPMWSGVGPTFTTSDNHPRLVCSPRVRARFFSPIPAFADRDSFDRRFDRAARAVYDRAGDENMWLGWTTSLALRRMLAKAGAALTRKSFTRRVERSKIATEVLPTARFRPNDHFGGNSIHLLRSDCDSERWKTARRFVRDF